MSTPNSSPTPTAEHVDFMGPTEAAKDIGCGQRWLRDGANHHGFPHHRFGKSLQFSAQDRAEIRRMHRVPAQPAKRRRTRKSSAPRQSAKSAA